VDKWRRHRRMITPAFNTNLLKQFFPVFDEKNKILIKNVTKELNKTQKFDLWHYIAPAALDTICRKYNTRLVKYLSKTVFIQILFKESNTYFK